jgi:hypothetical protein
VAGNQGENTSIVIHNSRTNDGKLTIDGMNFNHADGVMGGGLRAYYTNQNVMQEVALSTGSAGAEWETGGVNVNFIPKDGGNRFGLNALANFTNGALQSSNLNDRLRARGTTTAPYVKEISDVGTGASGPIVRDRVCFTVASDAGTPRRTSRARTGTRRRTRCSTRQTSIDPASATPVAGTSVSG